MVQPPSPDEMAAFRKEEQRKALLKKVEAPAPGNKKVPASTAARIARDTAKGIPGVSAPKKKMALAARLKARLSARRAPQQSKYTMAATTPSGLKAQMKDFKDGKTSQLPTPPRSVLRAPLGERGVVPGKIAQSAEKTKYLPKGKGGSGAAGSWLQWSGAKKGNN